jgi:DNA-binding Xre family transcriptional regulator
MRYEVEKLTTELNLNKTELSEYMQIPRQNLSDLITGKRKTRVKNISTISSLLIALVKKNFEKVTMDEVLELKEKERSIHLEFLEEQKFELTYQLEKLRRKKEGLLNNYLKAVHALDNLLYILQSDARLDKSQRIFLEERVDIEREKIKLYGIEAQLVLDYKMISMQNELKEVEKRLLEGV